ncbi:hypothetical protein KAK06_12600 [Ideonella sp. 4Y11]|uniref:Secreted protein n=1 Tax=Ideonella aquatica TaxID=2824119 RepID=A0A940YPT4_9BURK|nr:hypothetical protein [Ideonella aquatica]MBQ0959783.1 hypothetical protein [Ideonella aquatica]
MSHRSCLRLLAAASAAGCLMGLSAPAQANPSTYRYGNAQTYGCDGVADTQPEDFDFDPIKGERKKLKLAALAPSGSQALVSGGIALGHLPRMNLKALAAEIPPDCRVSAASAEGIVFFKDDIEVKAGDLPAGTPVTYTANVDIALDMPREGNGCNSVPFFRAYLNLSGPFTIWSPSAPFNGTYRMSLTKTTVVGDTLSLDVEIRGYVDALRVLGSNTFCAENTLRMLDSARVSLTTDVPGANTTSLKGVRYGAAR